VLCVCALIQTFTWSWRRQWPRFLEWNIRFYIVTVWRVWRQSFRRSPNATTSSSGHSPLTSLCCSLHSAPSALSALSAVLYTLTLCSCLLAACELICCVCVVWWWMCSDEGVNYAITQGIQLSRSSVLYFKHNDMDDLKRVLDSVKEKDQRAGNK